MNTVDVNDKMQKGYSYQLVEPIGENYAFDFKPQLTPEQMLKLGVFGGKYMTDCQKEFPTKWFKGAKLSPKFANPEYNFYEIIASQPLEIWQKKDWIYPDDPRGWFQWYCRYYMGRRIAQEDTRQIRRWRAMERHIAQLSKNCQKGDLACRRRQRQALLQWAYDSRQI